MQYSYVEAIAKPKGRAQRWEQVDLSGERLIDIYDHYTQVYVQVAHPAQEFDGYIRMDDVRSMVDEPTQTLTEWLASLDNQALPVIEGHFSIDTYTVNHLDAWAAGFNVEPFRIGTHIDTPLNKDKRPDLLLTRDDTDYRDLYRHTLISINGFIHRSGYSEYGLQVQGGAKTGFRENRTQIALTSFANVGELEIVDIDRYMLYHPHEDNRFYQQAHLNLGVSTENRSVILVLGGYPHVLDDVYQEIGDGLIQIDFNNYPMIQRYFDSKDALDLGSLPYTEFTRNEDQRMVSELLFSEQWIEAFLDLSQTFAVVVDTPNLYVKHHLIEDSGLPGVFISHERPTWPLKTCRGRWMPYWVTHEDDEWVVSCDTNLTPNYQFEHGPYEEQYSVANHRVPSKPLYRDRGYLIEIGRDQ